jgi:hypothetical protein
VRIILDDKLELAGLDNGSPSIEDLNINVINNSVRTYNGKCLFVLRTIRGKKGTSFVKVVGELVAGKEVVVGQDENGNDITKKIPVEIQDYGMIYDNLYDVIFNHGQKVAAD